MSFLLLPQNVPMVINDDGWIMESLFTLFPLKDGRNDDDVMFFG